MSNSRMDMDLNQFMADVFDGVLARVKQGYAPGANIMRRVYTNYDNVLQLEIKEVVARLEHVASVNKDRVVEAVTTVLDTKQMANVRWKVASQVVVAFEHALERASRAHLASGDDPESIAKLLDHASNVLANARAETSKATSAIRRAQKAGTLTNLNRLLVDTFEGAVKTESAMQILAHDLEVLARNIRETT